MPNVLFDMSAAAEPVLAGCSLTFNRVHQQSFFPGQDSTTGLVYLNQGIPDGVTLPGESEPPANGVRDSRGDLAFNRVDVATGEVTGVMYCRSFDHGSGFAVEIENDITYIWTAYDAVQQEIGTAAHGRRIARVPFVDGAVIDPTDPSIQDFNPIPTATSITPGFDPVNDQMAIAYYTPGQGQVHYRVFRLEDFKGKDFDNPLADFARPDLPDYQSWQIFNGAIYELHGTGYSDDNPPPPAGNGNAFFAALDSHTGELIQRVEDLHALDLAYREPQTIAFRMVGGLPQAVFGYAVSSPRLAYLYSIDATVQDPLSIVAVAQGEPNPGVELTVALTAPDTVQSWVLYRVVAQAQQILFSGTGPTLPDESIWTDNSPPGCIPLTYRVEVNRTTGGTETATSNTVTYVPAAGCGGSDRVVGEQSTSLGCAETYSAVIHWRGGAQPYPAASMERLTAVSWGRTINDVSQAQVTVLKGNVSPECCEALGRTEPWVHELSIYRDAELVWQGPVLTTNAQQEQITITALDVFGWLDKLVNTWRVTYTASTPDAQGRRSGPITYIAWNHLRLNLMESTLSVPPDYPGIMDYIVRRDTGLPTIKVEKDGSKNTAIWIETMGNIWREWAKRGLTWTTIGRALLLRGVPTSSTRALARLTLEDFTGQIEVVKDGTNAATYGFATTEQANDISDGKTIGTGALGTPYGRLDVLVQVQDENPSDDDLRSAARDAIAGRYPVPLAITVPDGSSLATTAPVKIAQLVPGERFDILADAYCTPILQGFMLSDVDVTWENGAEKVAVSFVPLGDVQEDLTQ